MKKLISIILFLFSIGSQAQVIERSDPPRLYNNFSRNHPDFLNLDEARQLEEKLVRFSEETSNQVCVVIVDDLGGLEPSDYATRLINQWGIGKKGVDNGAVVLLQLNEDHGGRDAIGVGYGLEGAIPDLATKRIRDEELEPNLKAGNNFEALDRTTTRLMQLAKGEVDVADDTPKRTRGSHSPGFSTFIIAIVILLIIIKMFRGGGGTTFSRRGRNYWGGGFGGFGGGFGGFGGGGSGGGFGGFGGGRSGGGGSSGSW